MVVVRGFCLLFVCVCLLWVSFVGAPSPPILDCHSKCVCCIQAFVCCPLLLLVIDVICCSLFVVVVFVVCYVVLFAPSKPRLLLKLLLFVDVAAGVRDSCFGFGVCVCVIVCVTCLFVCSLPNRRVPLKV